MFSDTKTIRGAAKKVGLSCTQLNEIVEILPPYVGVKEHGKKVSDLRNEYDLKVKKLESVQRGVERLKKERRKPKKKIGGLGVKRRLRRCLREFTQFSEEIVKRR